MSGQWIPRPGPEHRCKRPEITFSISVGDRWQCDCGAVFEVYQEAQHGESWKQWRLVLR